MKQMLRAIEAGAGTLLVQLQFVEVQGAGEFDPRIRGDDQRARRSSHRIAEPDALQ